MKKIYATLFTLLCSTSLFAQSLTCPQTTYQVDIADLSSISTTTFYVHNSSANHNMKWTRVIGSITANWTSSVCDNASCYGDNTATMLMTLPSAMPNQGDSGNFILHVNPHYLAGNAVIYLDVFDPLDSLNNHLRLTFNVSGWAAGVSNINSTTSISIFPNPVKDVATISFSGSVKISSLEIYNLVGSKVSHGEFVAGQNYCSFNMADLPKGMYFARLTKIDGTTITKSFSKN